MKYVEGFVAAVPASNCAGDGGSLIVIAGHLLVRQGGLGFQKVVLPT